VYNQSSFGTEEPAMPTQPDGRPTIEVVTNQASVQSDQDATAPATAPAPPGGAGAVALTFGPPVAPGEVGTLGPYRILKQLGAGGMGAVYAALDTRLERRLALKVMLPSFAANRAAKERFLREAKAAARIKHDNVVTVYEADERDGVPYIAMEFLEGYPLDQFLKKKGNPTIPQTLRIVRETAEGLAAAHARGLVHRDIKPANLWLEAPQGRVKVLDFGLARPVDAEAELTKSGVVVGTPAYMSPEQARGEHVDHHTDLFSLGVVLYRLCGGRLPFQGSTTMAVLMALGTQEPAPVRELNPEVPESLAALTHQLLAKDAAARPQSAAEVIRRVEAIEDELAAPQALPAGTPSVSQPQVLYVPIQVTAVPEQNPFADLDMTQIEAESSRAEEPAPVPQSERKKSSGTVLWIAAGVAALAALVVGGVIVIKNKKGSETKTEVPDGTTVTNKDKGGKQPAPATGPDRKGAEYAFSIGGTVWVNGEDRQLQTAAELPKERFTLTGANLSAKPVTDVGLANFKDCKELTQLHLGNTPVSDAGLTNFKDCKKLTSLALYGTAVTDAGLANFKDCKGLTQLGLSNTHVTDAGLAYFKDNKGLTALGLGALPVTDVGLANFKDCKGLTQLHLGGTKVTDVGLANFKDYKSLTALNLGGTPVTDVGLTNFKDCKNLMDLALSSTAVTDAGLANFKDCKGLAGLDLGNTPVTDAGLAHFKDCTALAGVTLNGTKVTDAGLVHLKDCKALVYLSLVNMQVTGAGLAHFKDSKALENLSLADTGVTDAGLAHLKDCKNLMHLELGGTKVTDAGLAHLKDCKELVYLGLNGIGVTDAGLAHLKDCKGLTRLLLSNTGVTDASLGPLAGFARLTTLDVSKTKLTPEGVKKLAAALPACKILHDGGTIEPKK
jgi:eukaryotic-like serine/threonine-protein kinase